jgi:hypothetical protein
MRGEEKRGRGKSQPSTKKNRQIKRKKTKRDGLQRQSDRS